MLKCIAKVGFTIAYFSTPDKPSLYNKPFLMNKQELSSWIKTVCGSLKLIYMMGDCKTITTYILKNRQ